MPIYYALKVVYRLRTSLCLQFKPHHIAAGAIFLAAKFLKVKLPSDGEKVWWQEFDVTPRHLEEISNQILELYEQSNVAPPSSQGNDTDRSPASVANHRASGKAPGSTGAPAAHEHHQASRQSSQQNMPGHRGYDHPDPEKQNSNQRTPQNDARDGVVNSNDGRIDRIADV
jgi:cyclin T